MRLLLDIDGVLNSVTTAPGDHWPEWKRGMANGYWINWAPAVVEALTKLHESGVEIIWLTTWCELANKHISPLLGLPNFPHIGTVRYRDDWWKLQYAKELWEKDQQPFIWIDDDLFFFSEAEEWLFTLPDDSYLALCPLTEEGITPDDLEQIHKFIGVLNEK